MCSLNCRLTGASAQELGQRGLAQLDRLAAQVAAIKLEQIERIEPRLAFHLPAVAQAIEHRHPVVAADHDLAVEQA
jgi:hypothetical protein